MDSRTGRRVRRGPRKFLEGLVEELIDFAEHEFRQERRLDDGASVADHQDAAARIIRNLPGWKGPKQIVEDAPPECPGPLEYLWGWFGELSLGIAATGMGPPMATWGDVNAWCEAMSHDAEPWEKVALLRLSNLRASVQSEQAEAKSKNKAAQ